MIRRDKIYYQFKSEKFQTILVQNNLSLPVYFILSFPIPIDHEAPGYE